MRPVKLLYLSFFLLIACEKEDLSLRSTSSSWKSTVLSLTIDDARFILDKTEKNHYLAIGNEELFLLNKDGSLENKSDFSIESSFYVTQIHDSKIYGFLSNSSRSDYDPNDRISVKVYNDQGIFLYQQVLESNGIPYDVEVISEGNYAILVYYPDEYRMALKHFDTNLGIKRSMSVGPAGTEPLPRKLDLSSQGDFILTSSCGSCPVYYVDNRQFSLKWVKQFSGILIHEVFHDPSNGIYISGSVGDKFDFTNIVALISEQGNLISSTTFDGFPSMDHHEYWIDGLSVNKNGVVVSQSEVELNRSYELIFFDHNLNLKHKIQLAGAGATSNLVNNELGGFTFTHGIAEASDTTLFPKTHPIFYKFDDSNQLPKKEITQ